MFNKALQAVSTVQDRVAHAVQRTTGHEELADRRI